MEKEAETGVMQKGLASTASMPEAPREAWTGFCPGHYRESQALLTNALTLDVSLPGLSTFLL